MINTPLSPQAALETLKRSVPVATFKKYENHIVNCLGVKPRGFLFPQISR